MTFVPLFPRGTFFVESLFGSVYMTFTKRIASLILAVALLASLGMPARAAEESTEALQRKLINYYQYYQADAQVDFDLLLTEMEKQDPVTAKYWTGIMDFWVWLNRDMEVHSGVLPDGLPEDDSLCIVVMGYYLKPDGGIREQLLSRLQVALASAGKYPNAYILCTGGGTASSNAKVTEASQMAAWLIEQGIDESRIILESKARSTIENAVLGCTLLYRDYPQVKNLAVITSDYHIFRSCLYFNTQAALDAMESGVQPMTVIANATCPIDPDAPSDIDIQVEGMCLLTDLAALNLPRPKLSQLEEIQVSGATEYEFGAEPVLSVTATYSSGYSRDVTSDVNIAGFDFGKSGPQTVTVSYAEGDIEKTAKLEVLVLEPPTTATQPPTEAPTETPAPTEAPTSPEPSQQEQPPVLPLSVGAVCVVALCLLIFLKKRQVNKRRRPKPKIKLD